MQPQREPSFSEKMEMMQNLMVYPALTVMVLMRKNLGYRLLNPLHIFGVSLVLFVFGTLATHTPNHEAIQLFAAIVFVFGLAQRFRRWIDFRRGIQIHSYYIGDSIFEFNWLPKFLRRNRRFTRLIDFLVCIIGGACLLEFCTPLGAWIIFSGFAVHTLEDVVHKRSLNRDLDTIDSMIASEIQAEAVERYMEGPEERRQQGGDEGIATGLSPDIQRKIDAKRRSKRRS